MERARTERRMIVGSCSAEGRASEFGRRENRGIREGWMRRRKETQKDGGKRGRKTGKAREREIRPETAGTRKREREMGERSSSETPPLRLFQVDFIYS